jgi:hypothetical protein
MKKPNLRVDFLSGGNISQQSRRQAGIINGMV